MADKPKNRACPACREVGHDKTGDHLFLMEDGRFWHCNRPHHDEPYFEPNEDLKNSSSNFSKFEDSTGTYIGSVSDIEALPHPDAPIRSISPEVCKLYGIRVSYDTAVRDVDAHFYPYYKKENGNGFTLKYFKQRKLPKDFYLVGDTSDTNDFFGMQTINSIPDQLVITEGELDAPSLYQMLSNVPVLSIPDGSDGLQPYIKHKDFLDKVKEIILCYDMDDAGEKSVAKVAKLYPDIRVMEMSEKDPNAMLEAGKNDEIVDAFIKRQVWKPKSIVKPSQVSEEAIQKIEWGLSYPFPRLTEITYGARGGRSIGVGAGPGAGKTTFINQIASHLAFEHGQPIGYAGAEYQPSYSLRQLVATVMEKPIHLPDCNYDVAEAREVAKKLEDKFFFYDIGHYNGKWDCIEDFIRYLHVKCGVIYFFLDPMSGLTAGMDDSRINQWLHNTMFKLSLLVRELGVTVFHVSHLNNPKSGKDHDEGGKITGAQWSGSRAQWRYSTELWGLERNQQAETIAEKNTVNVRIIKDRLSGLTGSFKLKYDRDAGILVPLGQSAGSFSNLNQP